ncbi:hypothetical protein [Xanthomonas nasturtii]|uniref:hypothetical protein n=1 Tax=Xanthomonas nasturtii TaxID=1843581 RepID=UPI0020131634|nr:hypothetical protein [Xanthomonas nasturtii]WVL56369.1 hypothetical protein M3O54_018890 [Xanthomonas nasturtii]
MAHTVMRAGEIRAKSVCGKTLPAPALAHLFYQGRIEGGVKARTYQRWNLGVPAGVGGLPVIGSDVRRMCALHFNSCELDVCVLQRASCPSPSAAQFL